MHVAKRSFSVFIFTRTVIKCLATMQSCAFMINLILLQACTDICTSHKDHVNWWKENKYILFYSITKYHKIFTYLPLDYAAGGVESWSCWMWDDAVVSIEEGLQKSRRKVVVVFGLSLFYNDYLNNVNYIFWGRSWYKYDSFYCNFSFTTTRTLH